LLRPHRPPAAWPQSVLIARSNRHGPRHALRRVIQAWLSGPTSYPLQPEPIADEVGVPNALDHLLRYGVAFINPVDPERLKRQGQNTLRIMKRLVDQGAAPMKGPFSPFSEWEKTPRRYRQQTVRPVLAWYAKDPVAAAFAEVLHAVDRGLRARICEHCGTYYLAPKGPGQPRKYCAVCHEKRWAFSGRAGSSRA
jgi:hypothetical protein